MIRLTRALPAILCLAGLAAADPAIPAKPLLHPLFSDEAVLQQGKPVNVWGWAAPGAEVKVVISGGAADKSPAPVAAKAGADGRWMAAIGPFPAGGPYTLTATSGEAKAEAKDVLFGEVWLCSGQSNMEMVVQNSKDFEAEKAKADLPQIRHIAIQKNNAGEPQDLIKGQWKVSNAANVGGFTAAGFFMARKLHADLKVPIGLVHSSWGGTPAEAWTSAEKLTTIADFVKPVADWQKLVVGQAEQTKATGKDYNTLIKEWYQANDPGTFSKPAWSDAAFDDQAWGKVKIPAVLEVAGAIPKTWDGTVWLRCSFEVPADKAGKHASLKLGRMNDGDTTWIDGRQIGANESSWIRSYGVPDGLLKAGANSLAIRMINFGGNCGFNAKPEEVKLVFDDQSAIQLAGEWRVQAGAELAKSPPLPVRFDRGIGPTSLYNGMIAPLLPMTHAGAIWYQGEANAGKAWQYRTLLPTMIGDWRARFGQGDLPFLIVSLANYMDRNDKPGESNWAELRDAQAYTAKSIAKGGLALAIDIGEAKDIHPKNKQEVGRRLALAAEAIAYGKDIEWSGPWYKGMQVDGASIRLSFDHLGGGLVASDNQPLTGFAIAGEDKQWVWAEAKIDGDSVVVSAPTVAKPAAVRYAWAHNPACNLANKAGLPAVPFRTDEWQLTTQPKPQAPPAPGK